MSNSVLLNSIKQTLQLAKQHQKLDPCDTIQTITYIVHVERLLLELDAVLLDNQLQSRNIREYIRQLESFTPPPQVLQEQVH